MLKGKIIRIIIDTNIWISSLLSARLFQKIESILVLDHILLFSKHLVNELERTVNKQKFQNNIDIITYNAIFQRIRQTATFVDVQSIVEICRDPKDNFLLALAKEGNADYLITGDKDLLILKKYGKTKIVTIKELEQII
ncbi:MAG: putative toxin-antitoxin system toxin component, PIN family [Planctomycetaceae bacterium]|jgi:putative PIN family toxin of toxin-antitoxin system|nr:putative toxin-antitoxin system toxin component, PIN family [Planctomycetaceae bacterium]